MKLGYDQLNEDLSRLVGMGSNRKIIVNIYNVYVTLVSLDLLIKLGGEGTIIVKSNQSLSLQAVSLESIPPSNSRDWSRTKDWLTWLT